MNYSNSSNMVSILKELYSEAVPTISERFRHTLYKLDLEDKDPMIGLLAWLPYTNNAFFGLVPRGPSFQGGYVPIPLEYSKPASPNKQAHPKLNRKARRTEAAKNRKAK